MNISLIMIGKTDASFLQEALDLYFKRINHYVKFDVVTIADIKSNKALSRDQQKVKEGELILSHLNDSDWVVLLDENGIEYSSIGYAAWLQKKMNAGVKRLCFIIGGPYGFSNQVYERGNEQVALSKMTFSHQMARVIFTEQLYRAFTIINNEPYHHQ